MCKGEVIQIAVALLLPEHRLTQAGMLEQLLWWVSPCPCPDASTGPGASPSPCPGPAASPCPCPGASPCPTTNADPDPNASTATSSSNPVPVQNSINSTVPSVRFALWLFGGALFYRGVR